MQYNFDNDYPIYLQIVEIITKEITTGILKPGQKLPSVREYAQLMKVNPNTVVKALSILEEQKLIYTERTNGKFVTMNNELIIDSKNEQVFKIIDEFILNMQKMGYTKEEIIKMIKER